MLPWRPVWSETDMTGTYSTNQGVFQVWDFVHNCGVSWLTSSIFKNLLASTILVAFEIGGTCILVLLSLHRVHNTFTLIS
jgi:hypothetical protein